MTHAASSLPLFRFASLRDLLDLLAMLRDAREPVTTPEGLKNAIEVLLKLGEAIGVEPALLDRVRSIAEEPHVLEIALAVLKYALSLYEFTSQAAIAHGHVGHDAADHGSLTVQSIGLAGWLAIAMQVFELLKRLRNEPAA
jgi:hypothetical protein